MKHSSAQDPIRAANAAEKTSRKHENARKKLFAQIFLEQTC